VLSFATTRRRNRDGRRTGERLVKSFRIDRKKLQDMLRDVPLAPLIWDWVWHSSVHAMEIAGNGG
jgi:hypothetical protein